MEKTFLSWNDIETAVESLAHQIRQSGEEIGAIVGLARGGLIPAVMLGSSVIDPTIRSLSHALATRRGVSTVCLSAI